MALYIVATPIGNRKDISLRALEILRQADLIAAEDTRHTRKLLKIYEINTSTISYHEYNEAKRAAELAAKMVQGKHIALVTDAGTPLVSDPGYRIVQAAIKANIPVVPLPGPTACMTALMVAGLPAHRFTFLGFPPKKTCARKNLLRDLQGREETMIFYESPRRMHTFLRDVLDILGDREIAICRELTKRFEEIRRGMVSELLGQCMKMRGECVLLVKGINRKNR